MRTENQSQTPSQPTPGVCPRTGPGALQPRTETLLHPGKHLITPKVALPQPSGS